MIRTATWSNIGHSVSECKNLESVLRQSGLDYTVEKKQVFIPGTNIDSVIPLQNRFVTMRMTDRHPYDVVSDKFEVIQNRDAFDFVNYMGKDLQFERAGETAGGMVYIIGKLPEVDILGDKFVPHVIFRNGFTGRVKITAAICPLRVVCQNQFNFAFRDTQNSITIRHVQNAQAKLEEAREVLKLSADYMAELNQMASKYVGMKLGQSAVDRVLDQMFPVEDRENMNSFKLFKLEEARTKFKNAYLADDNANFRGTAWGIINAYSDFITHKDPAKGKEEGRFTMVTFHPGMMNKIFEVMERVGVTA